MLLLLSSPDWMIEALMCQAHEVFQCGFPFSLTRRHNAHLWHIGNHPSVLFAQRTLRPRYPPWSFHAT